MTASATVLTGRKTGRTPGGFLLPYQRAWVADEAPRKLADKSRRTGWTWCEAYDAVSRRFRRTRPRDADYWFSSADESAAQEFIGYCRWFAEELFGRVADVYTDAIEDPRTKRSATAYCLRTPGGRKIVGMTSNPRRFRSKGGDVCLDEFAFHDEAREMYKAASPVTTWGGSLRIFSTPNGEGSEYQRLVTRARKLLAALGHDPDRPPRGLDWEMLAAKARALRLTPVFSYHRVTIVDAIEQGIVEKINQVAGTTWTREAFLQDCRDKSIDEEAYLEEYMCVPGSDRSAWLPFALIEACEDEACAQPGEGLRGYTGGPCTIGVDVGRSEDLTVMWLLEWVGDVGWTRAVVELRNVSLPEQQAALEALLGLVRWTSCAIDKTGIGLGLYEYAARRLGGRVEGVQFTAPAKQALAVGIKQALEDRAVRICADNAAVRDDLHRVRKSVTPAGLVRFDGERSRDGHADRFWALALAIEGHQAGGGVAWVPEVRVAREAQGVEAW